MNLIPQDIIIYNIFKFLDHTSRIRASAVSREWQDIHKAAPAAFPKIPWICFSSSTFPIKGKTNCYLLDPSSSTTIHNRICPPLLGVASANGSPYITLSITADVPEPSDECGAYKIEKQLLYFCYNPYTGDKIQFPLPHNKSYGTNMHNTFSFSSQPLNGLVVGWGAGGILQLIVFKPGSDEWVVGPTVGFGARDIIFYLGEFYCITEYEITAYDIKYNTDPHAFDPPGREIVSCDMLWADSDWPGDCQLYLVELDNRLLVVKEKTDYQNNEVTFMVYRLDAEKKELVRVHDLGDRSLFLQRGGSISSCVADHLMLNNNFFQENCIYFFHRQYQESDNIGRFHVGKSLPSSYCLDYIFGYDAVWIPSPIVSN